MKFRDKLDRKYLKIVAYVVLAVGLSYALILFMGQYQSIGKSLMSGINWVAAILKPAVIGAILAYILNPLVGLTERMITRNAKALSQNPVQKRRRHTLAVLITLLFIVAILLASLTAIIYAVTKQVQTINADSINALVNSIVDQAKSFEHSFKEWLSKYNFSKNYDLNFEKNLINWISHKLNSASGLPTLLSNITAGVSTLLFSVMFAVYFLFDAENLRKYWGRMLRTVWSQRANDKLTYVYGDVNKVFSGYFRGAAMDGFTVALLISIGLTVVGMPYGVMIGVMAGIANLIPYMGPIAGYGLTIVSGVISGEIKTMIISIVIISVVQVLDGAVINPKLLSHSIEIHPLLVLVAIIAGEKVGGFAGMIVAVPFAALLKIWFERLVERRAKSRAWEDTITAAKSVDGEGLEE